jgi:glutamine synthetase
MLQAQIARLSAQGMSSYFASELEFYLFDETYESAEAKAWSGLKTAGT